MEMYVAIPIRPFVKGGPKDINFWDVEMSEKLVSDGIPCYILGKMQGGRQ